MSARIAVIPARGGSKRIPRKNVRDFCGRPMIAHTIAAARSTKLFRRIIVSTDDAEIASVSRDLGAEAPFTRPAELSDDHTDTVSVIRHAVEWLGDEVAPDDPVCCLYATAPLMRPDDIVEGHRRLCADPALRYVFAITPFAAPIQRALRLDTDNGAVAMFRPEHALTRSQDLEPAYYDAAQFYWGRASAFIAGLPIFAPHSAAIVLPRWRVQDIDTEDDWARAELIFRMLEQRGEI